MDVVLKAPWTDVASSLINLIVFCIHQLDATNPDKILTATLYRPHFKVSSEYAFLFVIHDSGVTFSIAM